MESGVWGGEGEVVAEHGECVVEDEEISRGGE